MLTCVCRPEVNQNVHHKKDVDDHVKDGKTVTQASLQKGSMRWFRVCVYKYSYVYVCIYLCVCTCVYVCLCVHAYADHYRNKCEARNF